MTESAAIERAGGSSARRRLVQLVGAACVVALIAGAIALYANRTTPRDPFVAKPDAPASSPSGKFQLSVLVDRSAGYQRFVIHSRNRTDGTPLFTCPDSFSIHHTTFFLWDQADRVWVYSGDVGTFFWEHAADGAWNRSTYADSNVAAPAFLKRERPQQFPR